MRSFVLLGGDLADSQHLRPRFADRVTLSVADLRDVLGAEAVSVHVVEDLVRLRLGELLTAGAAIDLGLLLDQSAWCSAADS